MRSKLKKTLKAWGHASHVNHARASTRRHARRPGRSTGSMNKLNQNQKLKVRRFMDAAQTNDEIGAIQALKDAGWDMDAAFEYYLYSARSRSSKKSSTNAAGIDKMFETYKVHDDQKEERIEAEGIIKLLEDLGVDPFDPVTLVLSLKMGAETMGQYTKEEFTRGMVVLDCDSIDKLKNKLESLRSELQQARTFKDVYEFTFGFAKEPNAKALNLETAIGLWKILMSDKWCFTDEWCEFVEKKHGKPVSNDTWSQVLQFCTQVGENLQSYDCNDAWPYLIDEFVEHKLGK